MGWGIEFKMWKYSILVILVSRCVQFLPFQFSVHIHR